MRIDTASHRPLNMTPNLTPLVDVVVVVLVFLMLAGGFGGATHFLESRFAPPKIAPPKIATPIPHRQLQPLTLDLFIADAPDGVGFAVQGVGVERTADVRLLTDRLRGKADGFVAAGMAPGDVEVVLHPRRNVRFGHLTAVYEAAARARFSRIAFAFAE